MAKVPKCALSVEGCVERGDSQEVGLEAAILKRVRNSSLVERLRAENVPGLKGTAEAADGLGLWVQGVVGERPLGLGSGVEKLCGGKGSADAGMSSEK